MVWFSYLFQNFPLFIVIHMVKGFSLVNKAEVDIFLFHEADDHILRSGCHSDKNVVLAFCKLIGKEILTES